MREVGVGLIQGLRTPPPTENLSVVMSTGIRRDTHLAFEVNEDRILIASPEPSPGSARRREAVGDWGGASVLRSAGLTRRDWGGSQGLEMRISQISHSCAQVGHMIWAYACASSQQINRGGHCVPVQLGCDATPSPCTLTQFYDTSGVRKLISIVFCRMCCELKKMLRWMSGGRTRNRVRGPAELLLRSRVVTRCCCPKTPVASLQL